MQTDNSSTTRDTTPAARRRRWPVLLAAALAAAAAAAALLWLAGRHLVTTASGLVIVPKRGLTFAETRVDIRGWTAADAAAHPDLCRALAAAGHRDLLPPEPTVAEQAADTARRLRDEALSVGSGVLQRVRQKVGALQEKLP